MKLFGGMKVKNNKLYIWDKSIDEIVKDFKTPLYVMDEVLIRRNCKEYIKNFCSKYPNNKVIYAGKAFLTKAMCKIINEENLHLDVVSAGELYTAYKSGFPMSKIYFHGNNKTIEEIKMGLKFGVGKFVVDNLHELHLINKICKNLNKTQEILVRVSPGIDAHTHKYIKTAHLDSKFGFTCLDDLELKAIEEILKLDNIKFVGLHCHIGSQIFELEPYKLEVDIMFKLLNKIKEKFNIDIQELNFGGGFGIYYAQGDDPKTIGEYTGTIIKRAEDICSKLKIKMPNLSIEPGRSIVGNAGITLYSVGAIKDIPKIKKYVSIDGGMTDNIRPALYKCKYECILCNKVKENINNSITLVGKCCESGDVLINSIKMPKIKENDIIGVLNTGAYCYSMSSNYNKILKPAVALINKEDKKIICKRQSYEQLLENEVDI